MPKSRLQNQKFPQFFVCENTLEDSKSIFEAIDLSMVEMPHLSSRVNNNYTYIYKCAIRKYYQFYYIRHYRKNRFLLSYKKAVALSKRHLKSPSSGRVEAAEPFIRNPLDSAYIADIIPKNRCSLDNVIQSLLPFLTNSPRFHDATGEFQHFSVESAIEILKPNLICALLLDCNRTAKDSYSLEKLDADVPEKLPSIAQISRYPLKNYPEAFRSIFGIEKKSKSYEIQTRFQPLFATILGCQSKLPFWATKQSRTTNWNQNIALLNECVNVIFPSGPPKDVCKIPADVKNVDSYIMYYIVERLFRIGTKIRLFLAATSLEKRAENVQPLLSPVALADFFFSSPLVYLPDKVISQCLYSDAYFHMLIQLSAYWFPSIYYGLHFYLSQQKLTHYKDVLEFLLPLSSDYQKFYGECPIEQWSNDFLKRGVQMSVYNDEWSKFKPPWGYDCCYAFRTIDEWKVMYLPKDFSDHDRQVIKKIQRILK